MPDDLFGQPIVTAFSSSQELDSVVATFKAADLSERPPPVRWIWRDALARGKTAVLAAEGGTGKSALTVGLAIHRALGRPFLGRATSPGATLFLTAEDDPLDYRRKVGAWIAALGITADADLEVISRSLAVMYVGGRSARFVCHRGDYAVDPFVPLVCDWIRTRGIAGAGFDLVALETSSRFGADESNEGTAALITACEQVTNVTGAAVWIVSHTGKGAGRDDAYAARGGSALADNARASMLLRRIDEEVAKKHRIRADEAAGCVYFRVTRTSNGPADQPPQILTRLVVPEVGIAFAVRNGASAEAQAMEAVMTAALAAQDRAALGAKLKALVGERLQGDGQAPSERRLREFAGVLGVGKNRIPEVVEDAIRDGFLVRGPVARGGGRTLLPGNGSNGAVSELARSPDSARASSGNWPGTGPGDSTSGH